MVVDFERNGPTNKRTAEEETDEFYLIHLTFFF
jgi:hypothetical protein